MALSPRINRYFTSLALVAGAAALSGCSTTRIVEKPVCDAACQQSQSYLAYTMALANVCPRTDAATACQPKGIDPAAAAIIVQTYANANPVMKRSIEEALARRNMAMDGRNGQSCLTLQYQGLWVSQSNWCVNAMPQATP